MQLSEPRAPLIRVLYRSNAQRFIGLVLPSILEMIEVVTKTNLFDNTNRTRQSYSADTFDICNIIHN